MKYRRGTSLKVMVALVAAVTGLGLAGIAFAQNPHSHMAGYIPQRVYNSNDKRFSDFEAMLAELTKVDVVFVGEQHNDPMTHRLERAILEGLARRRENIVIAMEMFERDVQQSLNNYLAGELSEEEFLRVSRPWPNYLADYRPILEYARVHRWPVIASNVPRRYASQVSREGLVAVNSVSEDERKLIAAQIQCPYDNYFKRFSEVMGGHPVSNGHEPEAAQNEEHRAMIERFYLAQCIKDETMAESIAGRFQSPDNVQQKPLLVHFNGAFHSDYRLGAAARTNRRMPKSKIKVVTIVPVDDLDQIKADDYRKRGDYIIFSMKPAAVSDIQRAESR